MDCRKISIPVELENVDETIRKLETIKGLLKDIKALDSRFKLNNVIVVDDNTTLIFNCECLMKEEHLEEVEEKLCRKLQCKCIALNKNITLDNAIKNDINVKTEVEKYTCGLDIGKDVDYTTVQYYNDGELIREETIQYK